MSESTERPIPVKDRSRHFVVGFLLFGIPVFLYGLLSQEPIPDTLMVALVSGLVVGILAFIFGAGVINFIKALFNTFGFN